MMGNKSEMRANQICLKYCSMFLSFVTLVAGLAIVGMSLRIIFDPTMFHLFFDDGVPTVAYIMLLIGAVMAVMSILGCIGAMILNPCLLWTFFTVLLVLVGAEIAMVVVGYDKVPEFKTFVDREIRDTVEHEYGQNQFKTDRFNKIQESWHCCGSENFASWSNSKYRKSPSTADFGKNSEANKFGVPASCCIDQSSENCTAVRNSVSSDLKNVNLFFVDGCARKVVGVIGTYSTYGFVGIAILILVQIAGMILYAVLALMVRSRQGNTSRFTSRQGLNASYASAPMLSNADSDHESKKHFTLSAPSSVSASRSSLHMEHAATMSKSSSLV